jgi:hypothetical protein
MDPKKELGSISLMSCKGISNRWAGTLKFWAGVLTGSWIALGPRTPGG